MGPLPRASGNIDADCAEDLREGPIAKSVRQDLNHRPSLSMQRTFPKRQNAGSVRQRRYQQHSLNVQRIFMRGQLPTASGNIRALDHR